MISTALAHIEAQKIRKLKPRHNLRVHVSGDCATVESAQIIGQSMVDYEVRAKRQGFNSLAFTYTHSHKAPYNVPYGAWQGARVLANEQQHALELGYIGFTMIEADPLPTHKQGDNLMMYCPSEKFGRDCRDCMLCANVQWICDNRVIIIFKAHGVRKFEALNGKGGCYADLVYMNQLSNDKKITVTEYSRGKKIKGLSVTYASIKHTCPTTCAMYPKQFRN